MSQPSNEPAIQVVGLSGSLRAQSYTRMAVEISLAGAREVGAQVRMLDLNTYDLQFMAAATSEISPNIARLHRDIQSAQGIILGTPEYHGSFSGVLKHALDLMGFKEFEGKMVGLVSVAGGKMGGVNSLNGLRNVGRALHAWVVPQQAAIPEAWRQFDAQGKLKDPQLEEALAEVGRQVARFAFLHQSAKTREFLREWETAVANPGGAL